ncbi:hypothetical protein PENANT_c233G06387 [Penicillium antarcticum]|uniref:Uncharacterized protein n=1 Tax=Penicillium antarcticum TaxID=416450 RepID=A0A1V6P6R6_9EURO|nr:hypothetical protein PENANT_c233G06387 [Penicillium antarcticum]
MSTTLPPSTMPDAFQQALDLDQPIYLEDEDIVAEAASSPPPIPLTFTPTKETFTQYLEYTDILPEYPQTADGGYSYVVYRDKLQLADINEMVGSIQYSRTKSYCGRHVTKYPSFLGDMPYFHSSYKCSGVKLCQYTHPELKNLYHRHVTTELQEQVASYRASLPFSEEDKRQKTTYAKYNAVIRTFNNRALCGESSTESCKPVLKWSDPQGALSRPRPLILCSNRGEGNSPHWRELVKVDGQLDIAMLERLLNSPHRLTEENEYCGAIEQFASRLGYCQYDHKQGPGRLIHSKCNVTFHWYWPHDLNQYPYFIFRSEGDHTHPPPPSIQRPLPLIKEIRLLIQRDPEQTPSQFLRSPEMQKIYDRYGVASLNEIHESFNCLAFIPRWLYKARSLKYPAGQDFAGLEFETRKNPSLVQSYIPFLSEDIIVCMTEQQARMFLTLESVEIDMSFKRYRDAKELVLAVFLPEQSGIFTLYRVITYKETTESYTRIFTLIDDAIYSYTRFMDMDLGQYKGLAVYLQEHCDNLSHRDIIEELVIFCRIHFERGVRGLVKKGLTMPGFTARAIALLNVETAEEWMLGTQFIIALNRQNKAQQEAQNTPTQDTEITNVTSSGVQKESPRATVQPTLTLEAQIREQELRKRFLELQQSNDLLEKELQNRLL